MRTDIKKQIKRTVSILGAARSGLAAASFFSKMDIDTFISDTCNEEKLEKILSENNMEKVSYEAGRHTEKILESDLIIISPGIPSDLQIIKKARSLGIPVWSEIELGYRFSSAQFLAVTGSTGKSTTVSLLGEILKRSGKEYATAGNIGIPVISKVQSLSENGYVAAEISSFQLENIDEFRPLGAAVLNFMKNHLDRYGSEEEYYNAKKEIARNFDKENYLILNALDLRLMDWAQTMKKRTSIILFGENIPGFDCFWCKDNLIRYRLGNTERVIIDTDDMILRGEHNYLNACAASALAKTAGIDDSCIRSGLSSFTGLSHRLELAGRYNGIRFYNDSKSTTAESVRVAVSAFSNVHLIAGGRDKGCDFSVVNDVIRKHVKSICLIGEAAGRMHKEWNGIAPVYCESTLESAVAQVLSRSKSGDTIVFSPGCSSFDMFKNYEERGNRFKEIVQDMTGGPDNE
ncbi:MAG TPA: UDP-N-acetylmuramoyl-L-alanine--D-glutamate ligase [Chitinispirillaceae bacterium]|nr:UDP-N-acetylmuramoyl-L-alanine--D-glutamate ligase [Chitinispirillaceae bacterium]